MGPFHFDGWMVSLVRWSPTVDPAYPSDLTFWVRVLDVPFQFWAEPTFRAIGSEFGRVEAVDIDGGRVKVTVNGFKPLCLVTVIEFYNGQETIVNLRYERLHGCCKKCSSLCHDENHCPLWATNKITPALHFPVEDDSARPLQSYKGAIMNDRNNGKGKEVDTRGLPQPSQRLPKGKQDAGSKNRTSREMGESSSEPRRSNNLVAFKDYRQKARASTTVAPPLGVVPVGELEPGQIPDQVEHVAVQAATFGVPPLKRVRRSLFQEPELPLQSHLREEVILADAGSSVPGDGFAPQSTGSGALQAGSTQVPMGDISGTLPVLPTAKETLEENFEQRMEEVETEVLDKTVDDPQQQTNGDMEVSVEDQAMNPTVAIPTLGGTTADSGDGPVEAKLDSGATSVMAPQGEKVHKVKPPLSLKGAAFRKLNVYLRTTPRKRPVPKEAGEGSNMRNSDQEKGPTGGVKPPKPTADK
ncbi:PREDICTED: uncharacterized protein LOC104779384 [Camelina sativa]|uniref:Uncharacterized protein LOC104779384 n=1 Tax=Camelina sativa TaxID=90675 RepID=A0ABM1RF26_CAMSA|nr:PREDICTED: uncharacterized protein LOC104779384 [Camelina sativa]XP_019097616.1 PREDICTED: uncharacterized protein LOC104779384 [Camelina sativa]